MTDTATSPGFAGHDDLRSLLDEILPPGWIDAAESDDEDRLVEIKDAADNPTIVRRLGQAGWTAPHFPADSGGRGFDREAAQAVYRLLDRWEVPRTPRGSGMPLAAPTLLEHSSAETQRRLLTPLATGEERWCQLFSEPGAGSDMASLATTAVRDGDEWVINGQKVWTTFGHESEMAMLIARTDPDAPKHKGITYFGLDMRQPGVEVRSLINMAGQVEFNEVFLTDARVPDVNRISPVGEGWAAAMTPLGAERHALSGQEKKRKASDEILGGKPLAELIAAAAASGASAGPLTRQRLAAAHRIGEPFVASVDNDVAFFAKRDQLIDDRIDGRARFDQQHQFARAVDGFDNVFDCMGSDEVFSRSTAGNQIIHLAGGSIVDGDLVPAAFDVQG